MTSAIRRMWIDSIQIDSILDAHAHTYSVYMGCSIVLQWSRSLFPGRGHEGQFSEEGADEHNPQTRPAKLCQTSQTTEREKCSSDLSPSWPQPQLQLQARQLRRPKHISIVFRILFSGCDVPAQLAIATEDLCSCARKLADRWPHLRRRCPKQVIALLALSCFARHSCPRLDPVGILPVFLFCIGSHDSFWCSSFSAGLSFFVPLSPFSPPLPCTCNSTPLAPAFHLSVRLCHASTRPPAFLDELPTVRHAQSISLLSAVGLALSPSRSVSEKQRSPHSTGSHANAGLTTSARHTRTLLVHDQAARAHPRPKHSAPAQP